MKQYLDLASVIKKLKNHMTKILCGIGLFLLLIVIISWMHSITRHSQTAVTLTFISPGIQPLQPSPPDSEKTPAESSDPEVSKQDIAGETAIKPIDHYSNSFVPLTGQPTFSLIFVSMGLNPELAGMVIDQFPEHVAIGFTPYASDAIPLMEHARSKGHEVLLDMPIEPANQMMLDPGPLSLSSNATVEENIIQINRLHKKGKEHLGYTILYPSALMSKPESLNPVVDQLFERGYGIVDASGQQGWRHAKLNSSSNTDPTSSAISSPMTGNAQQFYLTPQFSLVDNYTLEDLDQTLILVEQSLQQQKSVVLLIVPYPKSVEKIKHWLETKTANGLVLAPVSHALRQQAEPVATTEPKNHP